MSSRALRKLQKEQEQERQLAALRAEEAEDAANSEDESPLAPKPRAKPVANAFDMLEGANEDNGSDIEEADEGPFEEEHTSENIMPNDVPASSSTPSKGSQAKKKKKKQKRKGKEKTETKDIKTRAADDMDEIDRALKELSTKQAFASARDSKLAEDRDHDEQNADGLWELSATKLLGIDSKALNPTNEMKSLFGNIALEGSSNSRSAARTPQRQREQNQQGGVDLATALTGRHSPASKGKELGALATRRNIFVQGHEDWPLGTSGGLSMESNGTLNSFEKHFSIIHNNAYTEVQHEFDHCVESMQADNMIQLLMLNPYHIATLLQVSEIAKHQGDHSVTADLLERALYTFGKSVHSGFPAALREGTARLSFTDPANRELYLTIWRYIQNLSMRGTWRTAYEWAKALLQFNTLHDPYGVTLMIDQLALRGRQHASFVELASDAAYGHAWGHLPNIQISLSLAQLRSSQPKLARQSLALAMHRYPYILSALASSLEISPLPKYLWGKLPATDGEKLYTELYITRAKDLWNTPETTSLMVEVAETMAHYEDILKDSPPAPKLEISLEEARHIMLLEVPSLIALLPRKFTSMRTSSSDVLPPPDSIQQSPFTSRAPASVTGTDASSVGAFSALLNAASSGASAPVMGLLARALNWFQSPAGPNEERNEHDEIDGAAALRELHDRVPPEILHEMLQMRVLDSDDGPPPRRQQQMLVIHDSEAEDDEHFVDRELAWGRGADDESDERSSHTADSLPDLENIPVSTGRQENEGPPVQGPLQRSLATTVEDELDDDEGDGRTDEAEANVQGIRPHPPPTHHLFAPRDPQDRSLPANRRVSTGPDSADPQRVQRWLISTGLEDLQNDNSRLQEYVGKLKGLRQRDRDWTLGIVKQKAGAEMADKVKRELER